MQLEVLCQTYKMIHNEQYLHTTYNITYNLKNYIPLKYYIQLKHDIQLLMLHTTSNITHNLKYYEQFEILHTT